MKYHTRKLGYLLLSASIILSAACSSSSSTPAATGGTGTTTGTTFSGTTAAATIDDTNAEDIGKTAGEAVQVADASTDLPTGISIESASTDFDQLNKIILSNIDVLTLPTGVDLPGVCTSGSASISELNPAISGPVDFTITYTNCQFAEADMTVNGSVVIHYNDFSDLSSGFSFTYNNFTVTGPDGTTTINMTMECTSFTECTSNSDFVGTDGSTHRVTEFSFSGTASTGFSGTATFLHSTYGSVSITATNITYGSCGSFPDGGTIDFSSSNGTSGSISFNGDCTVSGTWDNGTSSGSF